jgi:cellulose synthase/poly-beta-1,6-N-acetylglucosamine synthase-like glycosyltransferase
MPLIKKTLTLATWLVALILLSFTLRRWLFMLVALLPDRVGPVDREPAWPDVLLLVPVRNEAEALPGLLAALSRLDYPEDKLTVLLIDDGSTDDSQIILRQGLVSHPNWHLLALSHNLGKANALNLGLGEGFQAEIVAVYDADERPHPAALRILAQSFAVPEVGAVSGRRAISNSLASPAASYTTFENLVHQLVTIRAKDKLNLAPAILGANCAYRWVALAEVGGFKPGALLEDTDLTVKLNRAGWQSRFEPRAVSYHQVPETLAGYWKQHTRWARGFNEVARDQGGTLLRDPDLPLAVRLELLFFSLGYLDRLALLVGVGLALLKQRLAAGAVIVSLLTPFLQVMAALAIAQESGLLWRRVAWLPFFFGLDMAMACVGFWETIRRTPQIWEERQSRK